MSLFSSFFVLLLILVQSSPPSSVSISLLGACHPPPSITPHQPTTPPCYLLVTQIVLIWKYWIWGQRLFHSFSNFSFEDSSLCQFQSFVMFMVLNSSQSHFYICSEIPNKIVPFEGYNSVTVTKWHMHWLRNIVFVKGFWYWQYFCTAMTGGVK